MSDRATKNLRALVEQSEVRLLWGEARRVTPRLITQVFGDGKMLLALAPMYTRPNYFMVRVDSTTTDPRDPFPATAPRALLDDIADAAETEYGWYEDDDHPDDRRRFPVTDWSAVTWGKPFPVSEYAARRRRP